MFVSTYGTKGEIANILEFAHYVYNAKSSQKVKIDCLILKS